MQINWYIAFGKVFLREDAEREEEGFFYLRGKIYTYSNSVVSGMDMSVKEAINEAHQGSPSILVDPTLTPDALSLHQYNLVTIFFAPSRSDIR